jgi:predicted O-methyltransferase YrrM
MNSVFSELPVAVQDVLREVEELDKTYEVQLPATQNPKLVVKGVMHTVRLWAVPRETGEALYEVIMQHQPKIILELGTSAGYSTLWLALAAKQYGGRVITIDSSHDKQAMARDFATRAGVIDSITYYESSVRDALNQLSDLVGNDTIDAVFFDADKKNYAQYYQLLQPRLSRTHVILADDVVKYKDVMSGFISLFSDNVAYKTVINPVGHGLLSATTISD